MSRFGLVMLSSLADPLVPLIFLGYWLTVLAVPTQLAWNRPAELSKDFGWARKLHYSKRWPSGNTSHSSKQVSGQSFSARLHAHRVALDSGKAREGSRRKSLPASRCRKQHPYESPYIGNAPAPNLRDSSRSH